MHTEIKKYTYKDYADLQEGAPYQLIEGELVMSPSPTVYHQQILGNVFSILRNIARKNNLGLVLPAPMDVYFDEHETYQPDIIFVSKERKNIIGEKKINGAPDLVIEILSEASAYYDLKHKKNIYEKYGVKEYWIADPMDKSIEVFENKNGTFNLYHKSKIKGIVKSKIFKKAEVNLENIF